MCGSFNHGCDIIHPAVFGKKIYKTHGGNLPDDIYIYRMWKSYDIEENIKKGNRL